MSTPHTHSGPCQPPPNTPSASLDLAQGWPGRHHGHPWGWGEAHATHTHTEQGWLHASGDVRGWGHSYGASPTHTRPATGHLHRVTAATGNRPWLPPGCYSSGRARAELQGGRGEACWAGGQPEGHLVTGRQHRFSPIWTPDLGTPPGALQGGPIPVPGAPMKSVGPGCPGRACIPSCFVKGRADET